MIERRGLEFFILKSYVPLLRYLLTCQANLALMGRFFGTGDWAAATLKGLGEFQNKKNLGHFPLLLQAKNVNFKTRDFSPLIERVLARVSSVVY